MYEIVRFLHKSLITEEPSIKDNMKLSMEYFDSEVLIKQQEIVSFKISPAPSWPKLLSNAPSNVSMFLQSEIFLSRPSRTKGTPYHTKNDTRVFHWKYWTLSSVPFKRLFMTNLFTIHIFILCFKFKFVKLKEKKHCKFCVHMHSKR